MGSLDLPDQPDEPGRAEPLATAARAGRGSGRCPIRTNAAGPTRRCGRASPRKRRRRLCLGRRPDGTDQRSYGDEVPRFLDMGAEPDRSGGLPSGAPHRIARPTPRILPQRGRVLPEPRSGTRKRSRQSAGYGKPSRRSRPMSAQPSRRIGTAAGWRASNAASRARTASRRRSRKAGGVSPDKRPAEIAKVPDAIRYTFCVRPETYTAATTTSRRLESRGYEMY